MVKKTKDPYISFMHVAVRRSHGYTCQQIDLQFGKYIYFVHLVTLKILRSPTVEYFLIETFLKVKYNFL